MKRDLQSVWVSFNNLPSLPARFGNRTWINRNLEPYNCFKLSGCTCDDWDKGGKCAHVVPIKGNGLVFQNMCKEDSSKIERWRTRPLLASPRTFHTHPPNKRRRGHINCPWLGTNIQNVSAGIHSSLQSGALLGPPLPKKLYLITKPGSDVYIRYALKGIRKAAQALGGGFDTNHREEIEVLTA